MPIFGADCPSPFFFFSWPARSAGAKQERALPSSPPANSCSERTRGMEAIEVARFASERAFDLLVLDEAVSGIHAGGNVSGSSRHLRRRPSSLRPRRAPCSSRKQREGSTGVCEESLEDSAKKRRARRRQRTLLNSRCITFAAPDRSSNVCSWLETHLWHAKRMHMETLWGVSLPVHSQRGCRSLAEAVKRHAIVEDWSYFRTLELRGKHW
jgi:ribonuclease P/MRP protein subunit POP1